MSHPLKGKYNYGSMSEKEQTAKIVEWMRMGISARTIQGLNRFLFEHNPEREHAVFNKAISKYYSEKEKKR